MVGAKLSANFLSYYQKIIYNLAAIGRNCKIQKGALIQGGKRIYLGNNVILGRNSLLDAKSFGNGKIVIGDNTEIHDFARLMCYGGEIILGKDCSVNPFCVLYGHGNLKIGNKVRIAAHNIIIPANHSFDRLDIPIMDQAQTKKGIVIKDDVWIGGGVIILDGVTLGKGTVIGAGSVVTRDVPEYHCVYGVPAKTIKIRNK